MTDTIAGFAVTLETGVRVDRARAIADAIRQICFVIDVRPIVNDLPLLMAEERARQRLQNDLRQVLWPKP